MQIFLSEGPFYFETATLNKIFTRQLLQVKCFAAYFASEDTQMIRWSNSPFPDQGNLVWDVILLIRTVMSTQVLLERAFRSKVPPSQLFWNHGQTRSKFSTAPGYLWACLQLGVVSETQEGKDEIPRRLDDADGSLPVLQLPAAVAVVLIFSLQSLGTQVVAQQLIQVHHFVWFVGWRFQWGVFWGLLQNSQRRRLKKKSGFKTCC